MIDPVPAPEALSRLRAGNRRFVSGDHGWGFLADRVRPQDLAYEQHPFAVVLGCSDSRVPAEIVFDVGLGELFVIRVAGNVVTPSQMGSVEFAVQATGIRLVVVLGHSGCGAVEAVLDSPESLTGNPSPGLSSILDRIRPAVEEARAADPGGGREDLLRSAVRANVRRTVHCLRHDSEGLRDMAAGNGLLVTGAEYSLETGEVDFFDGV